MDKVNQHKGMAMGHDPKVSKHGGQPGYAEGGKVGPAGKGGHKTHHGPAGKGPLSYTSGTAANKGGRTGYKHGGKAGGKSSLHTPTKNY
jgi:hypothetical protein